MMNAHLPQVKAMPAIRRFALLLLPLLLLACAQLVGPRTVWITQQELTHKLAQRFPFERTLLELFKLTVDAPEVTLLPAQQRLAVHLRATLQERLSGREHHGALDASFGLRYDPRDGSLGLAEVRVDSLVIEGVSENAQRALALVGGKMVREQLEGYVVYRLKPEELARAGQLGLTVGAIEVTPQALAVRLVPRGN